MTTDIKEPADWSDLPRDMYVTHVKVFDGFVWEVKMCSVPMITVPEVRYVRADALDGRDRLKAVGFKILAKLDHPTASVTQWDADELRAALGDAS